MPMLFAILASAALWLSLATPSCAASERPPAAQTVRFTSLHWPPYSATQLEHQGATSAVLTAALSKMGYRVEIAFFPWKRATALVRGNSKFIAYFPEYLSNEIDTDFLLSDPIGAGPLGFAEHAEAPVIWERLEDLAGFRIGVVEGYVNSDQFDLRVRTGLQRVDLTSTDRQNLLKVAARRVPLAVIDRRVFDYLSQHDDQVAAVSHMLRFNPHLLENKNLYVCFRRNEEGERMRKIFNDGLKKIDVGAVMEAALNEINRAAGSRGTSRAKP